MGTKKEYDRYKTTQKTRDDQKKAKGLRAYWRTPSDKIALLVLGANVVLAFATFGLYRATRDLVSDSENNTIITSRAWIGPFDARFEINPVDKAPLKVVIFYGNTGRQPAPSNQEIIPEIMTEQQWLNGKAARSLNDYKTSCMARNSSVFTSVVFPTAPGTSLQAHLDTGRTDIPKTEQLRANNRLVTDGTDILVIHGCYWYKTAQRIRHTAFCSYYWAKHPVIGHLTYCDAGQDID